MQQRVFVAAMLLITGLGRPEDPTLQRLSDWNEPDNHTFLTKGSSQRSLFRQVTGTVSRATHITESRIVRHHEDSPLVRYGIRFIDRNA